MNVGRLSTASVYADSPLNAADVDIDAPLAAPGMAAPDGRLDKGYLVKHLQGRFSVVYFGRRGPELGLPAVRTLHVKAGRKTAPLFRRYGVPKEGATYVFRPDGHVLARCRGIAGKFARVAIGNVSKFRKGIAAKGVRKSPAAEDRDSLYGLLSACYDDAPASEREQALARLVVALSHSLPVSEVTEIAVASNPPRRHDARPRLRRA